MVDGNKARMARYCDLERVFEVVRGALKRRRLEERMNSGSIEVTHSNLEAMGTSSLGLYEFGLGLYSFLTLAQHQLCEALSKVSFNPLC